MSSQRMLNKVLKKQNNTLSIRKGSIHSSYGKKYNIANKKSISRFELSSKSGSKLSNPLRGVADELRRDKALLNVPDSVESIGVVSNSDNQQDMEFNVQAESKIRSLGVNKKRRSRSTQKKKTNLQLIKGVQNRMAQRLNSKPQSKNKRKRRKMKGKILKRKKRGLTCCEFLFFTNYSKMFDLGIKKKLVESDLFSLPKFSSTQKMVEEFDTLQACNRAALARNLLVLVQKEIILAIILKVLEQGLTMISPFLMTQYVTYLNLDDRIVEVTIIMGMVTMISFLSSILKEHSSRYNCIVNAKTGQCLRGVFFSHIMTANYSFLRNIDTSFIAKMTIYEFEAIIQFIGNIYNFVSFPFTFILAVVLIVSQVGESSLSILVIFTLVSLLLGYLEHKIMKASVPYKNQGSKRTKLLSEMMTDIKSIKINSWEEFYRMNLVKIRDKEAVMFDQMTLYKSICSSLISLTPLVCSVFIIMMKKVVNKEKVDVTLSLAIVTVLNQLQRPLKILSSSVDLYLDFEIAHTALKNFLKLIEQKPIHDFEKPWLKIGEIRLFDCSGCFEDDIKSTIIIDKIFNRRNLKSERLMAKYGIKNNSSQNKLNDATSSTIPEGKSPKNKGSPKMSVVKDDPKKNLERNSSLKGKNIINMFQLLGNNLNQSINRDGLIMLHVDVTLDVRPGEKICLMGKGDSGCSGVLHTIREETKITHGNCQMKGSFSYINLKEEFFIDSSTLRENILLDEKFNKKRYHEVLKICEIDISIFKGQDMVEVIENGRNFSSSERKKTMLARFLYSERDVYLFDHYFDDYEVCNQSVDHFDLVVNQFLENKTIIYLSNKEQFIRKADRIYVFNSGTVVDSGHYIQLEHSNKRFFKDTIERLENQSTRARFQSTKSMMNGLKSQSVFLKRMSNCFNTHLSADTKQGIVHLFKNDLNNKNNLVLDKNMLGNLFKSIADIQLKKIQGRITSESEELVNQSLPYLLGKYIFIVGKCRVINMSMLFLISVSFLMFADIWLGVWSLEMIPTFDFWEYLGFYAGISVSTGIFFVLRDVLFNKLLGKNSDYLHYKMIDKFLNTEMNWFNKNPSSRITYRLTRDQLVTDDYIIQGLQATADSLIILFGGLLILNYIYFGIFFCITIIIFVYVFFVLRKFFIVTHGIVQLESEKKASLQAMYLRSMNDSIHYRELCMLENLRDKFFKTSDEFQRTSSNLNLQAQRWLGMRIMWIRTFLIFVSFLLPLISITWLKDVYSLRKWQLALGIAWSLKITDQLPSLISDFSKTVHLLISVGRMFNFINHPEVEWDMAKKKESNFSSYDCGLGEKAVFIKDLVLEHRGKEILKKIILSINRGQKVAVIGSPGSGKHSLMNVLMGIFKKKEGTIRLFGISIEEIAPQDLRKFGMHIAEEPVLFGVTVRESIDPKNEYETKDLIKILAFLGFFKLIKINMESIVEIDEWNKINNNPHRKVQLLVNMADYLSRKAKMNTQYDENSNHYDSEKNKAEKQNLEMVNNMYGALVSDMLINNENSNLLGSHYRSKQLSSRLLRNSKPILQIKKHDIDAPLSSNREGDQSSRRSEIEIAVIGSIEDSVENKMRHKTLNKLDDHLTVKQEVEQERKKFRRKTDMSIKFADNLKNLDEFSLESIDLIDSPTHEYRTIRNFLNMQVMNKGSNIPWHMRRLVLFAKTILNAPRMLFIDHKALDLGYRDSMKLILEKLQNILPETLIIIFFREISDIQNFDKVVIMDQGKVIEEGGVKELLVNKSSELVKRLIREDKFYLDELLNLYNITYQRDEEEGDDSFNEASCPDEILNTRAMNETIGIGITIVPPRAEYLVSESEEEYRPPIPISCETKRLRKMSAVFESISEMVPKPKGDVSLEGDLSKIS